MSEAIAVLGLISAITAIFGAVDEIYEAAKDIKGLPRKFHAAAEQIPLVNHVLSLAKENINAKNVSEEALQRVRPILQRCKENAASVKEIFDKTIPSKDAARAERVRKAMGIKMKSYKVKQHMEDIVQNMELLVQNQVFRDAETLKEIKETIEQLSNMPDEEDQSQFVSSGSGPDLIDPRQVTLFDTLDQLSGLKAASNIDVPQLVVVGDQNSGKSSVLEAIARFHFLVNDRLCTRFPTKLILRRSAEERIHLSIDPGASRTEEERKRLQQFKGSLSKPDEFGDWMKKVAAVLGVPSATLSDKARGTESTGQDNSRKFTDDILVVEKCGPNLPLVNLVDLPGLFQAVSEEQDEASKQMVTKIVEEHIKSKRSIILLVVSARSSFYNQIRPAIVQEILKRDSGLADRVVGVITHPDQTFSLNETLNVLNGHLDPTNLKHGWHVVKNQDQMERRCEPFEQRDVEEEQFFLHNPDWKEVPERQRGIKALKATLKDMFWTHTRAELPGLVSEVQEQVAIIEARLAAAGRPRSTDLARRQYLLDIARKFETLTKEVSHQEHRQAIFGSANPYGISLSASNIGAGPNPAPLCVLNFKQRPHKVYKPSQTRWYWSQIQNWADDCWNSFMGKELPEGLKRFKWTCCCGRTFTETVRELKPGAVRAWIQLVSNIQSSRTTPTPSDDERPEAGSSGQRLENSVQSECQNAEHQAAELDRYTEGSKFEQPEQEEVGRPHRSEEKDTHCQGGCEDERRTDDQGRRYVLLCFRVGKHTVLLEQRDMSQQSSISNDQDMFQQLRSEYRRKRWRYWMRLTQLKHIEFKQFVLFKRSGVENNKVICKVDIKDDGKEAWPPCGMPGGCHEKCPKESHGCGDYWYVPSPPGMEPPIPRNAMMHFFNRPAEAGTMKTFLDMLPKRHDELRPGTDQNEIELKSGWGLNYKEEVSWFMVAGIPGLLGFIALCWFMFHMGNDYKEASPPAALIMAFAAIILTLIKEIADQNVG